MRVTRSEWYKRVNTAWPATVPALTADEAARAARKLYRFALHRTFRGPVKVTSGNRYSWIRGGVMFVNPDHGWHSLVHLLSHYVDSRLRPDARHDGAHARLERRMIREVVRRGWLNGSLRIVKVEKPKPDPRSERYARIVARIARWEAKLKRAETALRKLRTQRSYYERKGAGAVA